MKWKTSIAAIPLFLGVAFSSSILAAPCNTTSTSVAGSPGNITTDDVTLEGASANDCGALYQGNNNDFEGVVQPTFTELGWGEFVEGPKADNETAGSETVFDVDWTISYDDDENDWLLEYEGDGLPLTLDLAVIFKQGNFWATWLFEGVVFAAAGEKEGTYVINWCTAVPQGAPFNCTSEDISHLSVYFQDGENGGGETQIPEPGSLLLAGLGLAGLALTQRRRRRV
jgi:hypothetical protein